MKQIKTLSFLLLMIPLLSLSGAQDIGDVPLHGDPPPGNIPHAPVIVPINCYTVSSLNSIYFYSDQISVEVEVLIVNTTTSEDISTSVYVGDNPVSVPLAGCGVYTVQVTLASGVSFYGEFVI